MTKKLIPNQQLLVQIRGKITDFPNKQGEYKRQIHYGLFLLCHQAGLRVSEAVNFDLTTKSKKGLYRINRPKGKKERFVYIPKEVIKELKKQNWQPNQTNRFNFYHFLKKIKQELNISVNTELTPHTLRRSFTTHYAEKGMPLPVLQKFLGHASIRTTALYWRDSCSDNNNDIDGILAGKNWLEPKEPIAPPDFPKQWPEKGEPISKVPPTEAKNPTINYKSKPKAQGEPRISNLQPKQITFGDQQPTESKQITAETKKELILLAKIKQLEANLTQIQAENSNLKSKLAQTNAEKGKFQVLAENEKVRADQLASKLKTIDKNLNQLAKIGYQQLAEKDQDQAQIIQLPLGKLNK